MRAPGPVLSADGSRLWSLDRFSGALVTFSVSEGQLAVDVVQAFVPRRETERWSGEVVYHTDLGDTRMTCDTCHPSGHSGGLFYTKSQPKHIYHGVSLRGIALTPPYFTPARFVDLETSMAVVLRNNRGGEVPATAREIQALVRYLEGVTHPQSPLVTTPGKWPTGVPIGDGVGDPARGLKVYAALECAGCHPGPTFSTDGAASTRGKRYEVDTPVTLPLRLKHQDAASYPLPAPSLLGLWDRPVFLHSGAGGFEVNGKTLRSIGPGALEAFLGGGHQGTAQLSPQSLRDLVAVLKLL